MEAIFIIGTDTGVGKTVVTGLLGWWLTQRGFRTITQKWVETGSGGDVNKHLRIMKKKREDFGPVDLKPIYSFRFPSSPHLAAKLEDKEIDPERIKEGFRCLATEFEYLLVEGTGGLLVPIRYGRLHNCQRNIFLVDIAQELGLPVLIVAGNRLGAINHTLLTIEALKRREMRLVGVVFNTPYKDQDVIITKDNPEIIEALSPGVVLGSLNFGKIEDLYDDFVPIGARIFERWMSG